MTGVRGDWLVVIDAQRAFGERGSPWYTPGFEPMADAARELVSLFDDRVAFTRFVPPTSPAGSWHGYYDRWSFARAPEANRLWELVAPWRARPAVDRPTFSKWGPELTRVIGEPPAIVLCGVSTDCCVLSTALAAVDHGAQVRVVADACTAEPALHRAALAILARRAPQVVLSTVEQERGNDHRRTR